MSFKNRQFKNLTSLYQYFDSLVEQDVDNDTLFASSYIRGFISLAASEFGSEEQSLSQLLAKNITRQLHEARAELNPQDRVIVAQYWQELLPNFFSEH